MRREDWRVSQAGRRKKEQTERYNSCGIDRRGYYSVEKGDGTIAKHAYMKKSWSARIEEQRSKRRESSD